MRMLKKIGRGKSLYWTLASIISACLGVICHIGHWEFERAQQWPHDYARLNESGLYNILVIALNLSVITALLLGVIAIVKIIVQIIENWKAKIISGIVEFLILIFVGFFLLCFTLVTNEFYRMRRAISCNMLLKIKNIRSMVNEYSEKYDRMPDADSWCGSLIENSGKIGEGYFHIGQLPEIECNFAFNENISNLPVVKDLPGNVVLLFEAEGDLNLSGGPELISNELAKDKYFLFKKQKFIYILFVDGTIVKYRLRDCAIAKYVPDKNKFTQYFQKGQTPYSPLRWKP